ncbi:MAG: glycosyltransferase [Lachnospiraceae bacterium]|nr:glycosyltransferase [Lachnospiraceae bacterium]
MAKIFKISNFKKTLNYLKKNGIKQAYYAVRERVETEKADDYHFEAPAPEELLAQKEKGAGFGIKFSILVPAYETKEEYLRAMLQSVLDQTYDNFELLLADASESDGVEQIVKSYQDPRIKYRRLKQNAGISANTNQALMYATGDYAALLDHDDLLAPDALYEMAKEIHAQEEQNIQLQMLYSDEDKCDGSGSRFFEVNRKPKFNLDLILSNNYICHFLVMKRQLMQELCFRTVCDGAQDYDLVLRAVSSMLGKDKQRTVKRELPIAHIPKVLYHWRCHDQSTAENPSSKQYAYDAGKRAVEDFVRSRNWRGKVSHIRHLGFYRVDYQPDLFANRQDTAVVGGKIVNKSNQIVGGACTKDGEVLYQGLHREYSGYMHRASLMQEVEAVDIRCMKASPAAEEVLGEMLGLGYMRNSGNGRFDWKNCLNDQADYQELSLRFCEKIRQKGWRIVWDPDMIEKIN